MSLIFTQVTHPPLYHHFLLWRIPKITQGIFFIKEKYSFSSLISIQKHMLQSNPHFSCTQKSEKIPKYSLDLGTPPWAKILPKFLEYFCYRKSFPFWPQKAVSTASILFLDLMRLIFLEPHYPPKQSLTPGDQRYSPSRSPPNLATKFLTRNLPAW